MRQRIAALGGAGIAAILGFLLLWGGIDGKPVSAMEKMAENIRKAKSYKCIQTVQARDDLPWPGKPALTEMSFTVYWLAPGSARTEHSHSDWKGPGPEWIEISPVGKPRLFINCQTKKFFRYPALRRGSYLSTFDNLANLGRFSGEADRELGTKEINGKKARGFQIEMKKMEAEYSQPGVAEIWLDPQSNLPVLVRYAGMKHLGYSDTQVDADIQWNIDLDPKLFDTTPPKGYVDDSPKPLALEEQVRPIKAALKIYAEASGGQYPRESRENRVHYDVLDDVCKMLGLARWPRGEKEGNAGKAAKAFIGFQELRHIEGSDPDFAYNGNTVGPKDKDKVLLRWKLDDGRYQVIFGDLRSETVTAEKLHALEGK